MVDVRSKVGIDVRMETSGLIKVGCAITTAITSDVDVFISVTLIEGQASDGIYLAQCCFQVISEVKSMHAKVAGRPHVCGKQSSNCDPG